jgi:hypothetical protein
MKGMKSIILIIMTVALLALSINVANAAVNVFVNATMPYSVLYQGSMVSANLTVTNNENFPVRIYSIGVHYDWMPANVLSSVDFGGNYVEVQSNSFATPGQLLIDCSDNVTTGYHSFYYNVVLDWYNSYTASWINDTVVQPGTIFVESPQQPEALQQLQFANTTLVNAQEANYSSMRSIADVNNATYSLSNGWSAYYNNDFQTALDDSNNVISLIADAKISEQGYLENISSIDLIVASVNQKLSSISNTTSPDTENAINQAIGYLNQTKQYIEAEDFTSATTYANLADHEADSAVNLQYYASVQANQTAQDRNTAQAALNTAQNALNNVSTITSTSAVSMVDNAQQKFTDATSQFNSGDYTNATITANVVVTLVDQANSEQANYLIVQARSMILSQGTPKSPDGKSLLAQANDALNQSESYYAANDSQNAEDYATQAYNDANQSSVAEQKWQSQNPLSNVTPGFGVIAALLAIAAVFILRERKA